MASNTKTKDEEKPMAADTTLANSGADEPNDDRPVERSTSASQKGGFFAIYKKGQGYWTRMGTAIGVGVLGVIITWQIYDQVPKFFTDTDHGRKIALIADAVFVVLYALLGWRLMNKPSNVDFLIATDSEMKKVNWTSKRELIGSTKVVIIFMFGIALLLFSLDLLFNTIFYWINILKVPWWEQVFGK